MKRTGLKRHKILGSFLKKRRFWPRKENTKICKMTTALFIFLSQSRLESAIALAGNWKSLSGIRKSLDGIRWHAHVRQSAPPYFFISIPFFSFLETFLRRLVRGSPPRIRIVRRPWERIVTGARRYLDRASSCGMAWNRKRGVRRQRKFQKSKSGNRALAP